MGNGYLGPAVIRRNTHIIVERIVADIDVIVKEVRFPVWCGNTPAKASGWYSGYCAEPYSSTSYTQIRICSTRPTDTCDSTNNRRDLDFETLPTDPRVACV